MGIYYSIARFMPLRSAPVGLYVGFPLLDILGYRPLSRFPCHDGPASSHLSIIVELLLVVAPARMVVMAWPVVVTIPAAQV